MTTPVLCSLFQNRGIAASRSLGELLPTPARCMSVAAVYVTMAFCDSRGRCFLTPDKMATSNGGGMEVDGAGKYLSFIPSFKSDIIVDECKYFLLCCIF